MGYNPGNQNISGQLIGQGIMQAVQGLAQGIEKHYQRKEEKKREEAAFTAILPFAAQMQGKDPNDKGFQDALKAGMKSVGPQGFMALAQYAEQAKRQQAEDAARQSEMARMAALRQQMADALSSGGDPVKVMQSLAAGGADLREVASIGGVLANIEAVRAKNQAPAPVAGFGTQEEAIAALQGAGGKGTVKQDPKTGRYFIEARMGDAPKVEKENPPPGYRFKPDGTLEAIQGGPAAQKIEQADQSKKAKQEAVAARSGLVVETIDRALNSVGASTAGVVGAAAGIIPGTDAYDLQADLDTIKANIGFQELSDMRAASPTGGALGQVAVKELEFLQAARGNLDRKQSPDKLKKNLEKIRESFARWQMAASGVNPDEATGAAPASKQEAPAVKLPAGWSIR